MGEIMTTRERSSMIFIFVGFLFFITACGQDQLPVALQPVTPEKPELFGAEGPITLLAATIKQGVPAKVAKEALLKYDKFASQVRKPAYITMIDFSQHSGKNRMFMVNRETGSVESLPVAHGSGSDPDDDGFPQFFSNIPNSKMSSLGAYLIAEQYTGKYGASLRLDGLERTNSNARARAVVLHPSNYVKEGLKKQGRSWGCPAVPFAWIGKFLERTRDGAFLYAYGINQRKSMDDRYLIQQWSLIPVEQWVNEAEEAPLDGE